MSVEHLATQALMAWLVAGRDPAAAEDGSLPYRRRCYWVLLVMVLLMAAFSLLLIGVGLYGEHSPREKNMAVVMPAIGVSFLLLTLFAAADLLAARVTLSPEGVDFRYPWRPGAFVPWDQVRSVSYSPGMYWFPVKTDQGTFRISELRDGLGSFREHLEQHTKREVWVRAVGKLP